MHGEEETGPIIQGTLHHLQFDERRSCGTLGETLQASKVLLLCEVTEFRLFGDESRQAKLWCSWVPKFKQIKPADVRKQIGQPLIVRCGPTPSQCEGNPRVIRQLGKRLKERPEFLRCLLRLLQLGNSLFQAFLHPRLV